MFAQKYNTIILLTKLKICIGDFCNLLNLKKGRRSNESKADKNILDRLKM